MFYNYENNTIQFQEKLLLDKKKEIDELINENNLFNIQLEYQSNEIEKIIYETEDLFNKTKLNELIKENDKIIKDLKETELKKDKLIKDLEELEKSALKKDELIKELEELEESELKKDKLIKELDETVYNYNNIIIEKDKYTNELILNFNKNLEIINEQNKYIKILHSEKENFKKINDELNNTIVSFYNDL